MASNVSDFIIETTTEAFPSLQSVPVCSKNPGHVGFHRVADLTVDILPVGCKTQQWLKFIRDSSKRVVKLTIVKPTGFSLFGTGYVYKRSDKFYIKTNEHVIETQEDVSNCKIEWFFDTEDRGGIETSHGVELLNCDKGWDVCRFTVNDVPQTVKQLLLQPADTPPNTNLANMTMIAISHPHGGPKTVTFGKWLCYEYADDRGRYIHTAKTCGGSSGAAVLNTSRVNTMYVRRYGWQYTHYAGRRSDVYNIKNDDETSKEVISETKNINYSVFGW